jgi:Mg-chelatase subunit ChlD
MESPAVAEQYGSSEDPGRLGKASAEESSNPQFDELARRLALEVVMPLARQTPSPKRGRGRLETVAYRHDSTELDLDRTVDALMGNPVPQDEDFWVRERVRTKRALVLMLDVSGSMRGEQLLTAAVAAAALHQAAVHDELAIIAFWRDAAVLQTMAETRPMEALVERILSLRAGGLTNLRFALETGLAQLRRSEAREQAGVILTDGGHNIGNDPLEVAPRFPSLHVIGTSTADSRVQACQDLAAAGNGRCAFVDDMQDVPLAIQHCLDPTPAEW